MLKDINIGQYVPGSSFIHKLDEYIHWYNETRIKISLGGMSPFQYRRSLGIAI